MKNSKLFLTYTRKKKLSSHYTADTKPSILTMKPGRRHTSLPDCAEVNVAPNATRQRLNNTFDIVMSRLEILQKYTK